MKLKDQSAGIAHLLIIMTIVVLAVVGFAGWRVLNSVDSNDQTTQAANTPARTENSPANTRSENAESMTGWMWNQSTWVAGSTPPACDEPIAFAQTTVPTDKVSGILYPGQKRGGNYKPHGGFKLNTTSNAIEVKAIMDGYVTSGARYIEAGEVQYMFTITNNCGIAYRFDHLLELSPAFQKLADTLPEAKPDDSRTTNITSNNAVKAGDLVATAVGFKKTANYSFDLGVYDYRQKNQAASSGSLDASSLPDLSQAGYALCWLDMFPGVDYRSLPAVDAAAGKTSDYC